MISVQYLNPTEGPTFDIQYNPPRFVIVINERVIRGIDKRPSNYSDLQREITKQMNRYFAGRLIDPENY